MDITKELKKAQFRLEIIAGDVYVSKMTAEMVGEVIDIIKECLESLNREEGHK